MAFFSRTDTFIFYLASMTTDFFPAAAEINCCYKNSTAFSDALHQHFYRIMQLQVDCFVKGVRKKTLQL